eukprot:11317295-Karenia_brevis.AAC.1
MRAASAPIRLRVRKRRKYFERPYLSYLNSELHKFKAARPRASDSDVRAARAKIAACWSEMSTREQES